MQFEAQNPDFEAFIASVFAPQPFMQLIAAELGRIEPGAVEIRLKIRSDLTQHSGAVHGGVIGALADNADGAAAASMLPAGQATVTAEYRRRPGRPKDDSGSTGILATTSMCCEANGPRLRGRGYV